MGSRGDVHPYVALGRGLARAGHRVTVATLEPFRDVVERHALRFHPLPDPLAGLKSSEGWVRWQSSDAGLWAKLRGLHRTLQTAGDALHVNFDACHDACRNADAVLSAFPAIAGPAAAARLDIFHAWALVQPFTPTAAFPHCLSPFNASRGAVVNRATYRVADVGFAWCFGSSLARWRDSGPVNGKTRPPVRHPGADGTPVLYGFSPLMLPAKLDWAPNVHVTGYWPLDDQVDWSAPDALRTFLDAGARPICVCHGSITGWTDRRAALGIIRDAVDRAGARAVIVSDCAGPTPQRPSDSTMVVDWAPAEWLFPRVRLVVHHGGAGTTGATLRAGRPSVVLPSCFDQPFWADRLNRLGVASAPLRPSSLDARELAARIRDAAGAGRERAAARCAEQLSREDGIRSAIEWLERYVPAAASGVRQDSRSAATTNV